MDKVIKMVATKLVNTRSKSQLYQLQITKQTCVKNDFGNPKEIFQSSKGFKLTSMGHPAIGSLGTVLFVRGDRSQAHNNILTVTARYLSKIIHAVREYNSHVIITDLLSIPNVKINESFIIE